MLVSMYATSVTAAACGDGTSPSAANKIGVGFQLARTSTASVMMAVSVDGMTPGVPGPTPTITTSAAGLRIECDGDERPAFRAGPYLVSVPVSGADGDDVTVTIDLGTWFLRSSGGRYSPAATNTPGQVRVRVRVQNNLRNACRAFKDKNKDGRED
jgi:hypothetical protein